MIIREEIIGERLEGPDDKIEYVKSKGVKIYRNGWGLYLRCIQEHMNLCGKCDKELEDSFRTSKTFILGCHDNRDTIILESVEGRLIKILINSFYTPETINHNTPFYLCEECSKTIHRMLQTSNKWKLGNKEYEPLVELSQYNETDYDDEAWVEVERRPATDEEIGQLNR